MRLFIGIFIGLFLAIAIAAGAGYFAFGDLSGSIKRDRASDISQSYDLMGFDRLDVGGVFEIDVTVGDTFSVVLSGSPEAIAGAEARVSDGVLILSDNQRRNRPRRWRDRGMSAVIIAPALNGIDLSGVATGEVRGVAALDFEIALSGVGDLDISGSCDHLDASVSGVGDLDAARLECDTVDVKVSGIGDADVYARNAVDAAVSGIGAITVHGEPADVDVNSSFLSKITIK